MKMTKLDWLLFGCNCMLFSGVVWALLLLCASPLIGIAVIDDHTFTLSQLLQIIWYYGGIALIYIAGLAILFFLFKLFSKAFGKYFHSIPIVIFLLTTVIMIMYGLMAESLYAWIFSISSLTFFSSLIFMLFWFSFYLEKFLIQKGLPFFDKRKRQKV